MSCDRITDVDDPELWVSLLDCWIQELLACERHEFADLSRTWLKTRRALVAWRDCLVRHGASADLYDHILATKPLNGMTRHHDPSSSGI